MKKFFSAVAVALVFCVSQARASEFQVEGVRVGPASEEKATDSGASAAPKMGESKSTAPPTETKHDDRHVAPPKESVVKESATKDGDGKKEKRATEKTQAASSLSNSTASTAAPAGTNKPSATSDAPARTGNEPASIIGASKPTVAATPSSSSVELTSVYRIGVGDVLDIRLLNDQDPRQSTLYTVLAGGVLDYPLLRDPLTVTGMTTDELAAQLIADFRHRGIYEHPQLRVGVREYVSHAVLISGLAGDPGTKILRREAIPLYVVVAEAQPKPEAGRAVVISHSTGKVIAVDLNDASGLSTLVQPGDVINLTARPPEFFYVGGEINSPGQKDFHVGMTLTQAVLASGGVTALSGGRVRVLRAGSDGRLIPAEYSLAEIESGSVPDPLIQAGDRIEIQRIGKSHK